MFTGTVGSVAKGSFFTESKSGYNPRPIWTVVNSCCTPPYILYDIYSGEGGDFQLLGDYVSLFTVGTTFTIINSGSNNGTYTVSSVSLFGSVTSIIPIEPIPDDTDFTGQIQLFVSTSEVDTSCCDEKGKKDGTSNTFPKTQSLVKKPSFN